MLELPSVPGNEKCQEILSRFVNDRLISLMEGIIYDEIYWLYLVDNKGRPKKDNIESIWDIVDYHTLMGDKTFAEDVSLRYLPRGYPLERANHEFLGLYALLKAKKEYVPELPMEYVLYHIIDTELDTIDEVSFDYTSMGEEPISTVKRIPEPDRSVVLSSLREYAEGEEYTAEDLLENFEDLKKYTETCFWDWDFDLLNYVDEDTLVHSELGEYLGIPERRDMKEIEDEVSDGKGGKKKVKIKVYFAPWELEE